MPSRSHYIGRLENARLAIFFCILLALSGGVQNTWSQTNRALPRLPPTPPAPNTSSRMNAFRQLLAMTPAEREKELSNRSPQDRQVLEQKVREFEALTPEQREARLQALQRQMDFRSLIRFPASNRVEHLTYIAEADRTWQTERLAQWDKVPVDLQSMILTNMKVLSFLFPDSSSTPGRPALDSRFLTSTQRDAMEKAITEWNQLPEEKREAVSNHFYKYFGLDDKKKDDALKPLSLSERRQMERTLERFNQLPRSQQARCMAGFQKFASLSPEARQDFLRNAEQWQKMSPQDRQVWRQLVNHLRPPLPPTPPGLRPTPPVPPAPTSAVHPRPPVLPLVGTN